MAAHGGGGVLRRGATLTHSMPLLYATGAGSSDGYSLHTLDHGSGVLRLDLEHRWDDPSPPQPLLRADELICDPTAGWLCSQVKTPAVAAAAAAG